MKRVNESMNMLFACRSTIGKRSTKDGPQFISTGKRNQDYVTQTFVYACSLLTKKSFVVKSIFHTTAALSAEIAAVLSNVRTDAVTRPWVTTN